MIPSLADVASPFQRPDVKSSAHGELVDDLHGEAPGVGGAKGDQFAHYHREVRRNDLPRRAC